MGRRLELQPAWLVGLMSQWAKRSFHGETRQLGFASGSSWMRGLKASPASSIDPTGYAAEDYTDLETAIRILHDTQPTVLIAVLMYHKPWGIQAAIAEGFPFGTTTYYDRLKRGHRWIADYMDTLKRAKRVNAGNVGSETLQSTRATTHETCYE